MFSILGLLFIEIYAKSNGVEFLSGDAFLFIWAVCSIFEFFWILALGNRK